MTNDEGRMKKRYWKGIETTESGIAGGQGKSPQQVEDSALVGGIALVALLALIAIIMAIKLT